jgi:hypothetical protein
VVELQKSVWRRTGSSERIRTATSEALHLLTGPPRTAWFGAEQHEFGPDSAYQQPQESPTDPNRKSDNAVAS